MPAPMCLGSASPDSWPPPELTQSLVSVGSLQTLHLAHSLTHLLACPFITACIDHQCLIPVTPQWSSPSFITNQLGGRLPGIFQASCLLGAFPT